MCDIKTHEEVIRESMDAAVSYFEVSNLDKEHWICWPNLLNVLHCTPTCFPGCVPSILLSQIPGRRCWLFRRQYRARFLYLCIYRGASCSSMGTFASSPHESSFPLQRVLSFNGSGSCGRLLIFDSHNRLNYVAAVCQIIKQFYLFLF